ncbi:MAG: DUF5916 domain-containing protein [Gemmatimonadaceae bacterium]
MTATIPRPAHARRPLIAAAASLLLASIPLLAQQPVYDGRQRATTAALPLFEDSIRVDGSLDEGVWRRAALLTGFSSYLPIDNRPADDSTEVFVWYSSTDMYIGVRAYEAHGPVHTTLAARDKIDSDDYIQILLDPFNDRRRAFVFGVNPLGAQADGVRTEGTAAPQLRGQTFGSNPPANLDLSPDFLFESKGRLTAYGYEIELRIPLKSLRFQGAAEQQWGAQVLRYVQHSGYQQTWTQARRGSASFLGQSGIFSGLRDLSRDVVVELNPELTESLDGTPSPDGWQYDSRPTLGGNVRMRLVPNIMLNATVRPDFSQVEADAAQVAGDTRFALFFPERRPFFIDGIELFDAPNNLVYTRRIVRPDAAVKLTGRVGRTTVAYMGAVDAASSSESGKDHPLFNVLRLRQDLFSASTAGLTVTDRTEGSGFSRVGEVDTRVVFGKVYTFNATAGGSAKRSPAGGGTLTAPLWDLGINRTGLRYGLRYTFSGNGPDFEAASGYVPRNDYVSATFYNRISFFGTPGSLVESLVMRQGLDQIWLYDRFWNGASVQETKLQLETVLNIRGGWVVSVTPVRESWLFDARKYSRYATVQPRPGAPQLADTVAFATSARTPTYVALIRVNTPQYRLWSGRFTSFIGRDVDFYETAPAHRTDLTADIDFRPSAQLRLTTSYLYSEYTRWRDGTTLSRANVPRVKVEYQLTRALFLRFVGQYDSRHRDALRDPATDRPILLGSDHSYAPAAAMVTRDFRVDWLFSYVPSPGTVLFAGYGSSLTEPKAFQFRKLERLRDGFFVKLSYLLRR